MPIFIVIVLGSLLHSPMVCITVISPAVNTVSVATGWPFLVYVIMPVATPVAITSASVAPWQKYCVAAPSG
jgi:hypothetical protein